MAAQPKKKISRVRGRTRRAHQARKFSKLPTCPQCHQPKPGHIICPECGYYAGKKLLHTKTDQRIGRQLIKTRKAQATAAQKTKSAATTTKKAKSNSASAVEKAKATEIKAEKKAKSTRTTDEVKASKVKNK